MAVKQEQSGKWSVQIDRKGIPRVRKAFGSRADAERFEREYLLSHQRPDNANADQRTLLELVGIWYRYHGINLSDGVARKSILEQMAVDLGNIPAVELTPQQFMEYRFTCTNRQVKPITAKTFNNRHGYLEAMYRKL